MISQPRSICRLLTSAWSSKNSFRTSLFYLPRCHSRTLHSEWCQVNAVSLSIDNQLGHGEAAGRGVQDSPAAMAGGQIGAGDTGHWAEERQAVLGHGAIAGLHTLWRQTRQGRRQGRGNLLQQGASVRTWLHKCRAFG